MDICTINNQPVTGLDVSTITISYQNQDDDTATIVFDLDAAQALPSIFSYRNQITIRDGSIIRFVGSCEKPSIVGNGSLEQQSIRVIGPWESLKRIFFLQTVSDSISGASWKSGRISLSGTTVSMITEVLNYAISHGANFSIGSLDIPAISIPMIEDVDKSCADLILQILRWVQGAVTQFDYTATPPRLNMLSPSSNAQFISIPADVDSFNAKRRDDLIPSGVRIVYERSVDLESHIVSGYGKSDTQTSSIAHISDDTAGAAEGPNVLVHTHLLSGVQRKARWSHFFSGDYGPIASYWNPNLQQQYFPDIGDMLKAVGVNTTRTSLYGRIVECVDPSYPACIQIGQASCVFKGGGDKNWPGFDRAYILAAPISIRPWSIIPDEGLYDNPTLTLWEVSLPTSWAQYGGWGGTVRATYTHKFFIAAISRASPYMHQIDVEKDLTTDVLETNPPGLAQAIYNSRQGVFHQGTAMIDKSKFQASKRLVYYDGIKSPIQTVSINLMDESVSLTFGPPEHLSPQDYFSLMTLK
jgi:hypothetical protein